MEKKEIIQGYNKALAQEKALRDQAKRKHATVAWSRLLAIILGGVVVWQTWGTWELVVLVSLLTIVGFALLVKFSIRLELLLKQKESLIQVIENELKALDNDFSAFHEGKEFFIPDHPYTYDLDVFGQKSIYQKVVRCGTGEGKSTLASWFSNPEYDKSVIRKKQEAVKELTNKVAWRQELNAIGNMINLSLKEEAKLKNWLNAPISILEGKIYDALLWAVPIYSFSALGLYLFDFIGFNLLSGLLLVPLAITGRNLTAINEQMNSNEKRFTILQTYAQLFHWIEEEEFESEYLKELKKQFVSDKDSASTLVKKLGKIFEDFESRNNIVMGILINAFLLWDIRQVKRLKKWQDNYLLDLSSWMKATAEFESLSSLANLAYNHADYTYPEFSNTSHDYAFENLGHPMIPREGRVNNSYAIQNLGSFSIITGANMAGKSTFLRTIGINMMLAMTGAPVCASKYVFEPIQLFSSMRTSDSLSDQESYFFSELKRLKQIVDTLSEGKRLFIILDEILKGTNSKDKAEGSKQFMEKLLKTESLGIIATHDLSLCELENEFPKHITNYTFEVGFVNDELNFDYKLHKGICQNMNASFLLRKMGLVDA